MDEPVVLWDQPEEERRQASAPQSVHVDRPFATPIYVVVCTKLVWWVRDDFTPELFKRKLSVKPASVFRAHIPDYDKWSMDAIGNKQPISWDPTFSLERARSLCRRANREGFVRVETGGNYTKRVWECGPHAIVDARTMRLIEIIDEGDASAKCPTCGGGTTESKIQHSG